MLTLIAHHGFDRHFYFGNLMYMVGSYMDSSHFTFKPGSPFLLEAGKALEPLRTIIFLQANGVRTPLNKLFGELEKMLGY